MFIEPVFGKKFFGREEVLGTLQKRVTALRGGYRQNLALTGPMLAGKSSILRHFLKNIKDPGVIPLYIEMDRGDFRMFCMRFMATLLYGFLKSTGRTPPAPLRRLRKERRAPGREPVPGTGKGAGIGSGGAKDRSDFEALKKACRGTIPETVRCIDRVCRDLGRKKENAAYGRLLDLTATFKTETGKACIVILDEFHNLSNFHLKRPFQTFGKFIMVQKNTMYIVSSSQKTLLKEILSRKLSLLFGNFEVIEIDGFDSQTARSFISDKIENIDSSCEDIKNYLIQVTEGNPFYLEVLANRFSELVRRKDSRYGVKECLLDAFSQLLYESEGVLNQYFINRVNFFLERRARKKFISILVSLARGNSTIRAIQNDMGRVDKDLSRKLEKLQEMDLVYNSGGFYKISEKLFEYWLKYVYSLKTYSMIDDMDIKYLEFKHSMDEDYKSYCEFSAKSAVTVICDLFKSFRNEKIRVNMNFRKMPRFDAVESRALSKNVFQITGRIKNKQWICHVKQGDIADECDISNLWNIKTGDERSKIARKIFIPLKGVEQNSFLLAKEQNIWVWDAQQLNKILRLFQKFELVP
ncbi:MAG: hypothetical protein DRP85_04705 [Candidatus Makaraimicrobium thalassicum]|nr:MAG: hypothetical protein DRP85_04705 [Candidatus Omnitrophota bacterium]